MLIRRKPSNIEPNAIMHETETFRRGKNNVQTEGDIERFVIKSSNN
jgi:hypothetical protein